MSIASRYSILFLCHLILLSKAVVGEELAKTSVSAYKVQYQSISERRLYPARVTALRSVVVPSEVEGIVQDMAIRLGQNVRVGQTLLQLKNPDPAYDFKAFRLKAPLSGIISSIDVAAGDRVTRGKNLLTIADKSALKVLVHVTSKDLGILQADHPGALIMGQARVPIRMKALSPILDSGTGTAACEWELRDPKKDAAAIIPGSVVQVEFHTQQRLALVVPESALVYRGKDPFVIRISAESKAVYQPVKILQQGQGQIELEPVLRDGDMIVARSSTFVQEGEALSITAEPSE